jgi:hypothetical protein
LQWFPYLSRPRGKSPRMIKTKSLGKYYGAKNLAILEQ